MTNNNKLLTINIMECISVVIKNSSLIRYCLWLSSNLKINSLKIFMKIKKKIYNLLLN